MELRIEGSQGKERTRDVKVRSQGNRSREKDMEGRKEAKEEKK